MMHLGWFVGRGFSVHGWQQDWWGDEALDWTNPDIYLTLAQSLDRACFDYMMIEDGSLVPDAYEGSSRAYLQHAVTVPKADPMPLVPLLGHVTKGLGIIATMTTAFYPPYLGARLAATLDHLTRGRAGINLVTAHNDRAAQNFGLDQHFEHDQRYEMASEWIEVVDKLWASWEPGAVRADREAGIFADVAKVAPIGHEGAYYRCRGPLNLPPGPQGRPVVCQAGGSPAGPQLRRPPRRHRHRLGARPGRSQGLPRRLPRQARGLGTSSGCLQAAVLRLRRARGDGGRGRGAQAAPASGLGGEPRAAAGGALVLRRPRSVAAALGRADAARSRPTPRAPWWKPIPRAAARCAKLPMDDDVNGIPFVGTPDSIAAEMEDAMAEIGGDGFLFTEPLSRRNITEITDGLVPALQRRGLVRAVLRARHLARNPHGVLTERKSSAATACTSATACNSAISAYSSAPPILWGVGP